jgi:hypothetical protein
VSGKSNKKKKKKKQNNPGQEQQALALVQATVLSSSDSKAIVVAEPQLLERHVLQLKRAIMDGSAATVQQLLLSPINLDQKDERTGNSFRLGLIALAQASKKSKNTKITDFLQNQRQTNETTFRAIVASKNVQELAALLDTKAGFINGELLGRTFLYAFQNKHIGIAACLIKRGFLPEIPHAIRQGNEAYLSFFFENHLVSLEQRFPLGDDGFAYTPLEIACVYGQGYTAYFFLKLGASLRPQQEAVDNLRKAKKSETVNSASSSTLISSSSTVSSSSALAINNLAKHNPAKLLFQSPLTCAVRGNYFDMTMLLLIAHSKMGLVIPKHEIRNLIAVAATRKLQNQVSDYKSVAERADNIINMLHVVRQIQRSNFWLKKLKIPLSFCANEFGHLVLFHPLLLQQEAQLTNIASISSGESASGSFLSNASSPIISSSSNSSSSSANSSLSKSSLSCSNSFLPSSALLMSDAKLATNVHGNLVVISVSSAAKIILPAIEKIDQDLKRFALDPYPISWLWGSLLALQALAIRQLVFDMDSGEVVGVRQKDLVVNSNGEHGPLAFQVSLDDKKDEKESEVKTTPMFRVFPSGNKSSSSNSSKANDNLVFPLQAISPALVEQRRSRVVGIVACLKECGLFAVSTQQGASSTQVPTQHDSKTVNNGLAEKNPAKLILQYTGIL